MVLRGVHLVSGLCSSYNYW